MRRGVHCGTTALLSVELAEDKTLDEVRRAVPELSARLQNQAKRFAEMPCGLHQRMRMGAAATAVTGPGT